MTTRDAQGAQAADNGRKGGYHDGTKQAHSISMPATGLQGLLKAAFNDPALEAQLKAPGADAVAIAAAAGFSITADEFNNALQAWEDWRISGIHDEED